MHPQVTVLGDGAFGTAIAALLAHNGYAVTLWCYNAEVAKAINATAHNIIYAPDIELPKNIYATNDIKEAVANATHIFEAIPVVYLRNVLTLCIPYTRPDTTWVLLSKGIEETTLFFSSDIVTSLAQKYTDFIPPIVVGSGPSFARDILAQQPTGITLASYIKNDADSVAQLLENGYFKTTYTDDILGVQAVAALKNIYAIGMGIMQDSYTDNTKTLFIMQALAEQKLLLAKISGDIETAYTLAGLGDLLLTCYSNNSRNIQAGKLIAQQYSIEQIGEKLRILPEGIHTLKSIAQLQNKYDIEMPLAHTLYKIVYEHAPKASIIEMLLHTL